MPGSWTTPGRAGARDYAPVHFAFRHVNGVGTRDQTGFAAQWLAYMLPCRRFADVFTDACARLGADVGRYSFIAVDFHHILLAGLPAHLHPVAVQDGCTNIPLAAGRAQAGETILVIGVSGHGDVRFVHPDPPGQIRSWKI